MGREGGGSRYVAPDVVAVRAAFGAAGFQELPRASGQAEIAFGRVLPGLELMVVVYTTIDGQGAGESGRGCGEDAGRVIIKWAKTGRPVWSAKKVLRTKSFLANLLERAREAWRAGKSLRRCPDCGAPMVERESRTGNRFLGCARFPDCRHTERLEVLIPRAPLAKCPSCGNNPDVDCICKPGG